MSWASIKEDVPTCSGHPQQPIRSDQLNADRLNAGGMNRARGLSNRTFDFSARPRGDAVAGIRERPDPLCGAGFAIFDAGFQQRLEAHFAFQCAP